MENNMLSPSIMKASLISKVGGCLIVEIIQSEIFLSNLPMTVMLAASAKAKNVGVTVTSHR